MTNKEVIKMLTAKAECMRRETSGTDFDCNFRNCYKCDLNYEQGTIGDQIEALSVVISALRAQDVPDTNVGDMVSRRKAIDALCSKCTVDKPETCSTIQEGDRWCEEVYTLLNMPSAQPEIIRCKDCKWWSNDDYRECSSPNYDDGYVTPAGFYCGYAERRTDELGDS